jgi:hypothetical protein
MIRIKKCKCKNCLTFFRPDPRNAKRQKFCGKPECRKASKKASQRKWLNKLENKDYFRGPENVKRVQQWRSEHPGSWRRNKTKAKTALQDPLTDQPHEMITRFLNRTTICFTWINCQFYRQCVTR